MTETANAGASVLKTMSAERNSTRAFAASSTLDQDTRRQPTDVQMGLKIK